MSKNVPNRVQTCYEVIFFEIIMPCRVKKWRKMKKNRTFEISMCPKTFLKVSKHVLNLFWGNFLGKKVPSAPRNVKTWNNFKKLEKLSHFENDQKRSQKQSNMFWTCFEEIFSAKLLLSAPWGFERRKMENMENFNLSKVSETVPNSVQTSSEIVLRYFFRKEMASTHWRVETWKNSKKIENISVFQKCPKTYPTVFKHVTMWFFEIIMPCRVENWNKMKTKSKFWKFKSVQKRS